MFEAVIVFKGQILMIKIALTAVILPKCKCNF